MYLIITRAFPPELGGMQSLMWGLTKEMSKNFMIKVFADYQENHREFDKNEIPKPMGSRHPSIAPFEAFKTKDSYIIIAAGNDKLFEKLCNLLEIQEIIKDSKFSDNSSRAKNMNELKKILENKLSVKNTDEWVNDMEKEKIPCGPIFNIKEAVENPQVESRNMIVKAYHKVIGDFKLAGNPIKMSSYKDEKTRGDIPDLDEHREKILKEFI